jgi:hypothetical protein
MIIVSENSFCQINNLNSKVENTHIEFYKNGEKKIIASIKDGKLNGEYKRFHKNGKIAESGTMVNNLKNNIWRFFTEEGILDKVEIYSNDELLFVMNKSDFSLYPKFIESENIEIFIPINWETDIENIYPFVVMTSVKKCDDSFIFCPNITIIREKLQNGNNFNDFVNMSTKLLQQHLTNFKTIVSGYVTINGFQAFQIIYLMYVDNIKLGGITTLINYEEDIYTITGMACNEKNSEFLKYKDLFREIIASFKKY